MSVAKKIAIVIAVVLLFVFVWLIPSILSRPSYVDTFGKIVYVSDAGSPGFPHLWISKADGSDAKQLTSGAEHDASPAFSPSGSQIVFISDKNDTPQVWTMDADGKNTRQITIGSDSKAQPAYSPDGSLISYVTGGTLMTTDTRGGDTESLLPQIKSTSGSTADVSSTPHIAVVSYRWQPIKPGQSAAGLAAVVVNGDNTGPLDGTQELELLPTLDADVKHLAVGALISFDWTPDGSNVLGAIMDLLEINPGPAVTLPPQMGDMAPATQKGQTISGVFSFGLDGGNVRTDPPLGLQNRGTAGPQNPVVSPDGTTVSYEAWPSTTPDPAKIIGIVQQPIGGGQGVVVYKGPATDLTWDKEGSHFALIVPVKNNPVNSDLYVFDMTAHTARKLTDGQAHVTDPVWSPQPPPKGS